MCPTNAWCEKSCVHKHDIEDRWILIAILFLGMRKNRPYANMGEIIQFTVDRNEAPYISKSTCSQRLQQLKEENFITVNHPGGNEWKPTQKLRRAYEKWSLRTHFCENEAA